MNANENGPQRITKFHRLSKKGREHSAFQGLGWSSLGAVSWQKRFILYSDTNLPLAKSQSVH